MISCVRDFGNYRGFGICIPRGDITLQDKTLQITLYCHQYGNKRNRHSKGGAKGGEPESWSSVEFQPNQDQSGLSLKNNEEDNNNLSSNKKK